MIRTLEAGSRNRIPNITLAATNPFDTDDDGLPDLAERVVGTNPALADTDGDGIPDGAEVRQGTNPLDGLPARTGLVGSADTPGVAQDVCATNNYAAIADGDGGVSVFNVFSRMSPRAISRAPIRGTTTRVACDGRWVVAVASGDLSIIDLRDPPAAREVRRIAALSLRGDARSVVATASVAYAGLSSGRLVAVDLPTGTILETIDVGAPPIDLAIEGVTLFILTERALHSLPLDAGAFMATSGFATPSTQNQRLFVGGGLAYLTHPSGLSILDVTNPGAPALIRHHTTGQFGWRQTVLNGSRVGIAAVGGSSIIGNQDEISVYDLRNPADPLRLETIHDTPGSARAVSIYNGLAYVADHDRGIAVINYRAADTGLRPPTIALSGSIDFARPPIVAEEGKLVVLRAEVSDDVEVRNVEFFIDGVRVALDGNFPFEHRFATPSILRRSFFTVQARASDTGGNAALTPLYRVTLVADATAPRVVRVAPAPDALVGRVGTIAAFVTEPLNLLTLVPASFTLVAAGPDGRLGTGDDVPISDGSVSFRDELRAVFRTFTSDLPAGRYRATATSSLMDRAGNVLAPPFSWDFSVYGAGVDTDGDGVPDDVEIALGLAPNRADTDNDGTPDGLEDFDNDGLTNAAEVLLLRDPRNPDTDGDGTPDGMEDEDLDGLDDRGEILARSNPFIADTDGDGFLDGDEVAARSDPVDRRSTPVRIAFTRFSVLKAPVPDRVHSTVSIRNDQPLRPATATGVASVQNTASGPATARMREGPTFTVENQAP